ncbi:hypothetical protein VD659_10655 [Herbiconiux sp. 11R-BC]|uniref:hypothetical protein n=1 Tax=Herbiconiux sp. 11R-BC TaxID=3111637 RepID=UPI003BFFD26C
MAAALTLAVFGISVVVAHHLPKSLTAEYVPPPGNLIDHGLAVRADRRIVAAMIADLAMRGRIRVLAPRGSRGPVAVQPLPGTVLARGERAFLAMLNPSSPNLWQTRVRDQALREIGLERGGAPDLVFLTGPASFPSHRAREVAVFLAKRRTAMGYRGLTRGLSPGLHLLLIALCLLATGALGLLGGLGALMAGWWPVAIAIAVVLAGLLYAIAVAPPTLTRFTPAGTALRRRLSGLRYYMRLAEQERIRFLASTESALRTPAGDPTPAGLRLGIRIPTPAVDPVAQAGLDRLVLTERLLPYAILFRQEKSWRRELRGLAELPASEGLIVLGATTNALLSSLDALVAVGQVARMTWSLAGLVTNALN